MKSSATLLKSQKSIQIGLVVAVCCVVFLLLTRSILLPIFLSSPTGTEFSPYSFTSREFRINPWFGGTVVQPAILACSVEISKHLTNSTRTSGIERWDLVRHAKAWGAFVDAEASILVNCVKAIDHSRDFVWEKWSKDNPELAKVLWPSVQKLAIHRAYFAIPELLQFAATCPAVADLQSEVDEICQCAASDQVARLVAKQDFSEARITLEWGKTFGSSPEFDRLEMLIRQGFISLVEPKK